MGKSDSIKSKQTIYKGFYKKTKIPHDEKIKTRNVYRDSALGKATEKFLQSSGHEKISKYIASVSAFVKSEREIPALLKNEIRKILTFENKRFGREDIFLKGNIDRYVENLKVDKFTEKSWIWSKTPYALSKEQYAVLMNEKKFPLHMNNYKYDEPLYNFSNNYRSNERSFEKMNGVDSDSKGVIMYTDAKYYIGAHNIAFAKVVSTQYKPIDSAIVEKKAGSVEKYQQQQLVNDPALFDRTLSVVMYCFLNGSPSKAHPYFRYDSGGKPHHNLFINNTEKQKIFGDVAKVPHFHFQNSDDDLICLKKLKGDDNRFKYKTGRCNAIDIDHLIDYLSKIEKMDPKKITSFDIMNNSFDMPFLSIRQENRSMNEYLKPIALEYAETLNDKDSRFIKNIILAFNQEVKLDKNTYFAPLKNDLRFLNFLALYKKRIAKIVEVDYLKDIHRYELISQLEVRCADKITDMFNSNAKSEYVSRATGKKLTVGAKYLEENKKKGLNAFGNEKDEEDLDDEFDIEEYEEMASEEVTSEEYQERKKDFEIMIERMKSDDEKREARERKRLERQEKKRAKRPSNKGKGPMLKNGSRAYKKSKSKAKYTNGSKNNLKNKKYGYDYNIESDDYENGF